MISKDIETFETEAKNIESKFEELTELYDKKDLIGMLALNVHLEHFKQVFEELDYLKKLAKCDDTEELLYVVYEGTLQIAGTSTRKFNDFTKENTDMFTRLKLRSIEERIGKV